MFIWYRSYTRMIYVVAWVGKRRLDVTTGATDNMGLLEMGIYSLDCLVDGSPRPDLVCPVRPGSHMNGSIWESEYWGDDRVRSRYGSDGMDYPFPSMCSPRVPSGQSPAHGLRNSHTSGRPSRLSQPPALSGQSVCTFRRWIECLAFW